MLQHCVPREVVLSDFDFVYVVVHFYFSSFLFFHLFQGMVKYANEFKTKENQKLTEIKN